MKNILLSLILMNGLLMADYSRDDKTNIVTDSYSGLMWQDEENIISDTWENAMRQCKVLELGGYDDWRLPNINELFRIVNKSSNYKSPRINKVYFRYTESSGYSHYWSSTTSISNYLYSWGISFNTGEVSTNKKTDDDLYIRCVRGGK